MNFGMPAVFPTAIGVKSLVSSEVCYWLFRVGKVFSVYCKPVSNSPTGIESVWILICMLSSTTLKLWSKISPYVLPGWQK
jgi:hypothetical protein